MSLPIALRYMLNAEYRIFLQKLTATQFAKKLFTFMKYERSLLTLQKPAIVLRSEPVEFSPHPKPYFSDPLQYCSAIYVYISHIVSLEMLGIKF
jgi:hypothetical protein